MIVLKILLWLILAILGIILLFLVIPAGAEVSYIDKKLTYKISYGFINLYDSEKKGILTKFLEKRRTKKKKTTVPDDDDDLYNFDDDDEPEIAETDEDLRSPQDYEESAGTEPETDNNIYDSDSTPDNTESGDDDYYYSPEDDDEESESIVSRILDKLDRIESKLDTVLDVMRIADKPMMIICKGFKFSNVYIDFMITDEDAFNCAIKYGTVSGTVYNIIGWLKSFCTVKFRTVDIFPDFKKTESRWDISVKFSFNFITPIVAGIVFLITYIFKFFIPKKKHEKNKEK